MNTPMTAADAAKLVKRMVAKTNDKGEIVKDRDKQPRRAGPIKADRK